MELFETLHLNDGSFVLVDDEVTITPSCGIATVEVTNEKNIDTKTV